MFLKIISILGSLTFLSRIFGYIRDLLIAKVIGAGLVSEAGTRSSGRRASPGAEHARGAGGRQEALR